MFLLHLAIFVAIIIWWFYAFDKAQQYKYFHTNQEWIRAYRNYEYSERETKSVGQRKYVWLKWTAPLIMLAYLAGNWFLWDTAWEWSSLVVVRNGQVVEMDRTVVWTGDGTTTRIMDRPYHPKEFLFSAESSRESKTVFRVLLHARPDTSIPDRDWVQMEVDGRDGSNFAPQEVVRELIRLSRKDSRSTEVFLKEELPNALKRHAWILDHVHAVELAAPYSYGY